MWEVPKYRVRAYLRSLRDSRKREQERRDRGRFHFKRTRAELKVGDTFSGRTEILSARVVLNDFSSTGLRIFTSEPLAPGTEVALTLEEPRYFYVRGRVRWCHPLPFERRVMTQQPFSYRVGIEFQFSSIAEEAAVENYCRHLFLDHLAPEVV
jgi:hypothetical protein